MRERIYIYIYIERARDREREREVCVEASVFASWLLKIPSATLITKACFGGKKDPKSLHYEEINFEFGIF